MRTAEFTCLMIVATGAIFSILPVAHLAHATGTLYINPTPVPSQAIGSTFTLKVSVANVDPFAGWDIAISTNQTIVNATVLSTSGNTLTANESFTTLYEAENCVNGNGQGCYSDGQQSDGPGIVHSIYAATPPTVGQLPPGPYNGLLFTVRYQVVGSGPYSPIQFLSGQSYPVISGTNPVSFTPQDGVYGTKPVIDFTMARDPSSLNIVKGSNSMSTITVSSIGTFSGIVNLTFASSTNGLSLSLNSTKLDLTSNQVAFARLSVSTNASTAAIQYTITITGRSGSLSHQITVTVHVLEQPDFLANISPSLLKIHAGDSGLATITLDTQTGFAGSVHLKVDLPPVPGLMASLGSTDLMISPGRPAQTFFAVRTPPSDLPFQYLINITASSQSLTHPPFLMTVRSPAPNFDFRVATSAYVIQAGQSGTFTLNATSIDYFKGELFLLASSLSGLSEKFSRSSLALDFNSSISSMTIQTDTFLSLGNHFINVTALGTTFLGVPVDHSVILTVTIVPVIIARTILGLQPITYFGIIGALWAGIISLAIREIRKPKAQRFLS